MKMSNRESSSKIKYQMSNFKCAIKHRLDIGSICHWYIFDIPASKEAGYIALSSVLVVFVVVLSVIVTVTYLSIGEAQSGLAAYLAEQQMELVDSCAEEVLQNITEGASYSGSTNTITLPEGSCNLSVTSGSPNYNYVISTSNPDYPRQVRIQFTKGATITISSWQEI